MRYFARRRMTHTALLLAALVGIALWAGWLDASLARSAHATGYALYALLALLAAYNLRKKMPGLPLGSSSAWLQLHLYVAIGTAGLLVWHTGARWPNGLLESALALVYACAFGSGVFGLWITRIAPKQLARASTQVIFERIPLEKHRVGAEARAVVLDAVHATGALTLADFYANRLHGFFLRPRAIGYWFRPTSATRKRLFSELTAINRLLTEAEQKASERLFRLVQQKDDLDFHAARQGGLKLWIFAHLALTWTLLLLGALHGVLAVAFRGGTA